MSAPRKELKELTLLFDISITLNKSRNIKDVLHQILEMLANYIGMDRGTITLLNKSRGEIFIEAAYGLSEEEKSRGVYQVGEGIVGKVVASGMSVIIPKISDEPQFLDRTKARNKINKEDVSFLCVPIKHDKEVIGTLSVDRLFNNDFSFEEDIRLISIIGSMIAQTLRARQEEHEELARLQEENARLQSELKMNYNPANMIGNGQGMKAVYKLITKVAPTNATVLITGESGAGKEMLAKTIHFNSKRPNKEFVQVNCPGIPADMLEVELFGSESPPADDADGVFVKKGKLEQAHGGTLYMVEPSDMPLNLQAKLITYLQEKTIIRVGGNTPISLDTRVIAATTQHLERKVEEGKLMEELFYVLSGYPVHIPPLRERKSDIPLLIDHFIEKCNKVHNLNIKRISTSAIDMIMAYHWPGNVRELENCIERAAILSNTGVIYGFHLPPTLQTPEATTAPERGPLQSVLAKVEKELIQDNLKLSRGDLRQTSENLGLTERQLTMRLGKFNIDPSKYKVRK
jgi:Nif-specific regulatory protein